MPTLTRGTSIDLARSGFSIPLDRWALSTEGFWREVTGIPIAPPACWIPVTIDSDRSLLVKAEPTPALIIGADSSIEISIESEPTTVTVATDATIQVKVC